jgi:hypothetical protein
MASLHDFLAAFPARNVGDQTRRNSRRDVKVKAEAWICKWLQCACTSRRLWNIAAIDAGQAKIADVVACGAEDPTIVTRYPGPR